MKIDTDKMKKISPVLKSASIGIVFSYVIFAFLSWDLLLWLSPDIDAVDAAFLRVAFLVVAFFVGIIYFLEIGQKK